MMIGKDIEKAASLLESGQLVAIPTETVYGLAGNALDLNAVSGIFKAKNRPSFDPLILHCASVADVEKHVIGLPDKARRLAERFWPGSLTMVLPRASHIDDLVTSGLDTVAIRIPNHPIALELLQRLSFPLAAPSANPFGYVSPTTALHVLQGLGDRIPYILDGGACQVGIESTIVGFPDGVPTIYRKGGISIEQIEEVIGKVDVRAISSSKPQAPGMLHRHYAPNAKIFLGDISQMMDQYASDQQIALLSLQPIETSRPIPDTHRLVLSPTGSLEEAARNLFKALRELDRLAPDVILAELMPEKGLGVAINDRLRRAAASEDTHEG